METQHVLLALIPLIGWGLGDVFGIYSSRKVGSYLTTFCQFLFAIALFSLVLPFVQSDFSKVTTGLLVLNIMFGSLYVLANFFVNEGFKQASAPVVGIIIQSFPAIVLILSALIFKDPLSPKQLLWALLVFIGVFLCSVDLRELRKTKFEFDVGIKYALVAAGVFSIYFTFFRIFASQYGWFLPNYISFLTLPIALYLAKKVIKEKSKLYIPKDYKVLGAMIVSSLFIRSGDIALNLGVSQGLSSIVSPIAGAAPVVFVIASALAFKDKVTPQQVAGIVLSILGIIGLSFLV